MIERGLADVTKRRSVNATHYTSTASEIFGYNQSRIPSQWRELYSAPINIVTAKGNGFSDTRKNQHQSHRE